MGKRTEQQRLEESSHQDSTNTLKLLDLSLPSSRRLSACQLTEIRPESANKQNEALRHLILVTTLQFALLDDERQAGRPSQPLTSSTSPA